MDVTQAVKRYPEQISLDDGTTVTLAILGKEDRVALVRFFQRVPEEDRFYLKESVTSPETILRWIEGMDLERAVPIIAKESGEIVADATLHRSRTPARRHVGELRLVVDPRFRGRGLGQRLIDELIGLARALELSRVFFELVDRRESGAIRAAVRSGFEEVAVLKGRVRDMYGSLQDLVIMELNLEDEAAVGHL